MVFVAFFGPVIIFVVAIGLDYILNRKMPDVPAMNLLSLSLVSAYAVFVIRYMFGNFEEICWRASVLPRIQAKYSALISSLMVGLIQGVWHLPFLFVKGHYVQSIGLTAVIVQSMAMGIVATWIYNNTRGSLLMAALFHASNDALSQFQGNDINLFYIMIFVWCVAAIILSIIFGARHLSQKSDSEIAYAIISPENLMPAQHQAGA